MRKYEIVIADEGAEVHDQEHGEIVGTLVDATPELMTAIEAIEYVPSQDADAEPGDMIYQAQEKNTIPTGEKGKR